MEPALWGLFSAISLGCSDFTSRYSSRSVGVFPATLFALLFGGGLLLIPLLLTLGSLTWNTSGFVFTVAAGFFLAAMTSLLYFGLATGPVTLVAPVVSGHPVFVVAFWAALGARPDGWQAAALATGLLGIVAVAVQPGGLSPTGGGGPTSWGRSSPFRTAIFAALAYACLVITGQLACQYWPPLLVTTLSHFVAACVIIVPLLFTTAVIRPPLRWLGWLGLQGSLAAAGYLFLYWGSTDATSAQLVAVTSAGFGAVTALLGRAILRERVGLVRYAGIGLILVANAVVLR